ncbi:tRNA-splicing endonuclease subunit Sen2-like [Tigriopus californicus]|nr:tRNA-splicing endonuclease subunit Sen2-like [Tigriopus californicus]|eukprot:TCALIF_09657-PA protein Name:"Similar to TSEN2 tRNA-splicing endonuclease subunit Sen2 (Gallus gallus)" AED:0.68 eAED:0.68 QI:0/-1/0/1/-1/1/1/0/297
MSSLSDPRPKRPRKDEILQSPLPVPIDSLTVQTAAFHGRDWPEYRGEWMANTGQVRVSNLDQAVTLFTMGFFGDKEVISEDPQRDAQHRPVLKPICPKIDPERRDETLRKASGSQGEEEQEDKNAVGKLMYRPHMNERWPLILSPEEAFFLSYALGCLVVCQDGRDLNLSDLWHILIDRDDHFPVLYRVYHHFRSQGWVVRSGLKFGADFLLYQDGPPFFHSTYSVRIRFNGQDETMSWRELFGLNRITEATSKELLLVEVLAGGQTLERVRSSPDNLGDLFVKEVLVRRWVPSQKQ